MFDLETLVDELVDKFDGARPLEQGEGDSFVAINGVASVPGVHARRVRGAADSGRLLGHPRAGSEYVDR